MGHELKCSYRKEQNRDRKCKRNNDSGSDYGSQGSGTDGYQVTLYARKRVHIVLQRRPRLSFNRSFSVGSRELPSS